MHISGLNLILCGDKKPFPSKSEMSYFFLHFFFPQMIWQLQLSLASCWKQMHFSLEQGWRWDTAPFSANGFAPGSHPSAIAHCPGLPWRVCLQGFEAEADEEGLHKEEERYSWRARSGCQGLCHQEQWSVLFPPLAPHLPLHKTPLPRRVKGHFINTITKLLGSIPRGRWIAQQKQTD